MSFEKLKFHTKKKLRWILNENLKINLAIKRLKTILKILKHVKSQTQTIKESASVWM